MCGLARASLRKLSSLLPCLIYLLAKITHFYPRSCGGGTRSFSMYYASRLLLSPSSLVVSCCPPYSFGWNSSWQVQRLCRAKLKRDTAQERDSRLTAQQQSSLARQSYYSTRSSPISLHDFPNIVYSNRLPRYTILSIQPKPARSPTQHPSLGTSAKHLLTPSNAPRGVWRERTYESSFPSLRGSSRGGRATPVSFARDAWRRHASVVDVDEGGTRVKQF